MSIGLIGKKQGMTRVFTPEGESFAVSVVSVLPNVDQIRSRREERRLFLYSGHNWAKERQTSH